MSLPREVLPGRFYMLTRRCTQRQYLLRPDRETNNAFAYCLGEAAERFGIQVLLAQQMSNHHHTVLFDPLGNVIEFTEHFHKMLARCQNALRGRWENLWSSEPPCIIHLVDSSDVIDKLVYTATNPVLGHLVAQVHHWPGIDGVGALVYRRPIRATRPDHFFRRTGKMPASVTLAFEIPSELGDPDDVIRQVRARVEAVEAEQARIRAETGRQIVGRRCVLQQSWRSSPKSQEVRRDLRPRVAARSRWSRYEALQRNREFQIAYREARAAWLAKQPIPFPMGTYWLRRFVGVPIAAQR